MQSLCKPYATKSANNLLLSHCCINQADGSKDFYLPALIGQELNTEFLFQPLNRRLADIAKADGTLLGINTDKLKKGTRYEWAVSGEPGAAYRFVVTNSFNAQFQNIV